MNVSDPISGDMLPAIGGVRLRNGELHQRSFVRALGVRVDARYRALDDGAVAVDGAIVAYGRQRERALDTVFSLALPLTSGLWGLSSGAQPQPFPTAAPEPQTGFPLATVSSAEDELGIGYAVAPNRPCRFEMTLAPGTTSSRFELRQRWGLSRAAAGRLRSRAPFAFVVDLGVDPMWGYRSALQRYYDRSPEWFVNPAGEPVSPGAPAYGAWAFLAHSCYPNPSAYAFHLGGRNMWDPQTGADPATLAQFAANDEWDADERAGARTLPYTIPGQREVTDLPELPQSYDDAIAAVKAWSHPPIRFSSANQTNAFDSSRQQLALIENSSLGDADGNRVIRVRSTQWGGNSVSFPTNANPRLRPKHPHGQTLGRYLLGEYVPLMLSDERVDGIFSDSLYEWGRYFDYDQDHFPAATIPLTYADTTEKPASDSAATTPYGVAFKPGLYNDFSNLEYLWALRRLLHAKGKVLMTNGLRSLNGETRVFDGFACDVIGVEVTMNFIGGVDTNAAFLRETAYRKPVTLMMYDHQLAGNGQVVTDWSDRDMVETTWKQCLLHALVPGSSGTYDLDSVAAPGPIDPSKVVTQPLEVEFQQTRMPLLRTLAQAGWQPITGVQNTILSANPRAKGLQIERYGTGTDFHLVLFNQSTGLRRVSFWVDRDAVPGIDANAVDALSGEPADAELVAALRGNGATLTLEPGEFHVLHFSR